MFAILLPHPSWHKPSLTPLRAVHGFNVARPFVGIKPHNTYLTNSFSPLESDFPRLEGGGVQ